MSKKVCEIIEKEIEKLEDLLCTFDCEKCKAKVKK